MATTEPARTPVAMLPLEDYNYPHFRTKHFVADLVGTARAKGVLPGLEAPDFDLVSTAGDRVRLSDRRGRPTVLHFGSGT